MNNLQDRISEWIKNYAQNSGIKTLVVGISGGIDSAVVSTLCANTGMPVIAVTMPIRQLPSLHDLSMRHGSWLTSNFDNVTHIVKDLTPLFDQFETVMDEYNNLLGMANSRARLRMTCLYQVAQHSSGIVVGTGNRVEDFGVGFYTKYGDGGVDISPIGDLMKTEVWALGCELGILEDIINAAPTDGLWADGRTDQDQLGGLTYPELERAMLLDESGRIPDNLKDHDLLIQYRRIRARSLHKMQPIPVFKK